MYSESVGRAQYQGKAFAVTIICKSMALFEGITSTPKKILNKALEIAAMHYGTRKVITFSM